MHELSIAMSIVEIATEEAKEANCQHFSNLQLEIGQQSGIVIEALNFALEEAVKNTVLEGAKIEIVEIEAIAKCYDCGNIFKCEELYTPCPNCNGFNNELTQGKELKISKLQY